MGQQIGLNGLQRPLKRRRKGFEVDHASFAVVYGLPGIVRVKRPDGMICRCNADSPDPGVSDPPERRVKSFVEEIEEVLRERTPKYRAAADHKIATDHKTVAEIADTIQALLQTSQC